MSQNRHVLCYFMPKKGPNCSKNRSMRRKQKLKAVVAFFKISARGRKIPPNLHLAECCCMQFLFPYSPLKPVAQYVIRNRWEI